MAEKSHQVIIFIGPPGSGKDTQADLLAKKINLFRFKTSKLLEEAFNNAKPEDPDYERLLQEKEIWRSGKLNTPEWVASVVLDKVEKLAQEKKGIIFSASPRTLFEAQVLVPKLEKLYGRGNIRVVYIKLSEEESINRNSKRYVCKKNGHPIFPDLVEKGISECPLDGSEIVKRGGLDDPETIKVRYKEYSTRTAPILDYLKGRNIRIIGINGEQPISDVEKDIWENFSQ